MSQFALPPIQPFHPVTFVERGVAVPFTTPLLEGTRVRPAEKKGVELVVPNPSGGRGAYIIPWTGITSMCRPTLHDKILNRRIAALGSVTPATIRRVAREIAQEGLAGEAGTEAAHKSMKAEKDGRLLTNYMLLLALVEQVNLEFETSARTGEPPDMETRAKLTTAWIAPRLGKSTEWVAETLEALSEVFGHIGVGMGKTTARMPRCLAQLQAMSEDIQARSTSMPEDQAAYARMICVVADFTSTLAEHVLKVAQALSGNISALLKDWAADPSTVVRVATRPEWLLDGWEQICQIWSHAGDDDARRAALAEIATLIPVIPREANDWFSTPIEADQFLRFRRLVNLNEDWRSGAAVYDLIARNEHFRAELV